MVSCFPVYIYSHCLYNTQQLISSKAFDNLALRSATLTGEDTGDLLQGSREDSGYQEAGNNDDGQKCHVQGVNFAVRSCLAPIFFHLSLLPTTLPVAALSATKIFGSNRVFATPGRVAKTKRLSIV